MNQFKYIIYQHVNKVNGKSYIGLTNKTIEERFHRHCWDAFSKNSQCRFHKALRKYGRDKWISKILYVSSCELDAARAEEQLIETYNTYHVGYNGNRTGKATNEILPLIGYRNHMYKIGKRHPLYGKPRLEETKRKISQNHKCRVGSNNTNAKLIHLKSPNGDLYQIRGNLQTFCKQNKLAYSSMRFILKTGRKLEGSTKGWDCWIDGEPSHF